MISGRCESYQTLGDGTVKHLAILGPGDVLGEPDLLGRRQHATSARVITDSVLQRIPCADLRSLLAGNGHSAARATENIAASELISECSASHSGRIIAAFSLSKNLPNSTIVEKLAESLFAETAESVLLLRIVSAKQSAISCRPLDGIIDDDFHFREGLP